MMTQEKQYLQQAQPIYTPGTAPGIIQMSRPGTVSTARGTYTAEGKERVREALDAIADCLVDGDKEHTFKILLMNNLRTTEVKKDGASYLPFKALEAEVFERVRSEYIDMLTRTIYAIPEQIAAMPNRHIGTIEIATLASKIMNQLASSEHAKNETKRKRKEKYAAMTGKAQIGSERVYQGERNAKQ